MNYKPIIIAHRINTIPGLEKVPESYGVEIDVRHNPGTGRLYLNHDPADVSKEYSDLEEYLKNFRHAFIVFNIKEAGIEARCLELAAKYGVSKARYFLLDLEFPAIYRLSRKEGAREIAVRYSEAEPIEMALAQKKFVDWVWIDTNTILPLDADIVRKLADFKTCLVSPDRWGRPEDIAFYRQEIEELNLPLAAVMVGMKYTHLWE